MGQRVDNKLSEAKENNIFSGLSLAGLPFEEMVVLARLILKDTGAGLFYTLEDVQDLRAFNAEGNVTSPLITDHGGLGGLGDSADHAWAFLVDGARVMTGTGDGFKDEDNMASDSAVAVASQQSIKKYVDDETQTLFGIDINGDLQPVTETQVDANFELDGNDDVMPQSA